MANFLASILPPAWFGVKKAQGQELTPDEMNTAVANANGPNETALNQMSQGDANVKPQFNELPDLSTIVPDGSLNGISGAEEIPLKDKPLADSLVSRAEEIRKQRLAEEQAGLNDYQKAMNDYANRKQDIDWRPLAGLLDQWNGGGNLSAIAQSQAPQSADERQKQLMAMREKLAGLKGNLTKTQLEAVKDQLNNLKISSQSADKQLLQDQRIHAMLMRRLTSDPAQVKKMGQIQGLDSALALISDVKNLTPQQVHEAQQRIRQSLGIQGTSGVDERASTYINSVGLNAAEMKQFLTGNPAEISKDDKLVKHIVEMAGVGRKQLSQQMDKQINSAAAGYGSLYKRNPDLKEDLLTKVGSMHSIYAQPEKKQNTGNAPKVGQIIDGHRFKGGNPADQNNWELVE